METATTTGERSTTEGITKLPSSGRSTTLTGMRRASAASATRRLTSATSVAAITRCTPSRSPVSNSRGRYSTAASSGNRSRLFTRRGETSITRAPASSRLETLRTATSPPPTTRQGLFFTSRNIGRNSMGVLSGVVWMVGRSPGAWRTRERRVGASRAESDRLLREGADSTMTHFLSQSEAAG